MLYEVDHPGRVSLTEYEGMLAIRMPVRGQWEREDLRHSLVEQGEEGCWFFPELCDDRNPERAPVKQQPLELEGEEPRSYDAIYRLSPPKLATENMMRRYRYLFRYSNRDLYVPQISTTVVTLTEHNQEGQSIWEFYAPGISLWGAPV